MHVLFLSHGYPFDRQPIFSFFVKQQAEAVAARGHQVGVICPLAYAIVRVVVRQRAFPFGLRRTTTNNVNALLAIYPAVPGAKKIRAILYAAVGKYLLRKYI